MTPEPESILLALVLGAGFGAFVHQMGSTATRLAMFLFVLWVFQSAAQQFWRGAAVKGGDFDELIFVAIIRLAFGLTAIGTLYLLNARDLRRQP